MTKSTPRRKKITDEKARKEFLKQRGDAIGEREVAEVMQFERSHRGSYVGLMALDRLITFSGEADYKDSYCERARRHVMEAIASYREHKELPPIALYFSRQATSDMEPVMRELLNAGPEQKPFTTILFCEWALNAARRRKDIAARLPELQAGAEENYEGELNSIRALLPLIPSEEKLTALEYEAQELLANAIKDYQQIRWTALKLENGNEYLRTYDPALSASMPTVAEMAQGMLFYHVNLAPGGSAEDLSFDLLDGGKWRLSDQKGKVVVIQFSFRGCGACEIMYPTLDEIHEEFNDRVSVLTIMTDKNKQDAMDAATEHHMQWNIYWDGYRRPITTRWAVRSYPTCYVIGADGKILNRQPSPDKLLGIVKKALGEK